MESIIQNVQEGCKDVHKVSDYRMILEKLAENEFMEEVRRGQIDLGTGRAVIKAAPVSYTHLGQRYRSTAAVLGSGGSR